MFYIYEVWHNPSANMISYYDTQDEAFAFVLRYVEKFGLQYVVDLCIMGYNKETDDFQVIFMG